MTPSDETFVRPIVRYDEDGQITIYPDKHCSHEGCGVGLTSRNRYGKSLMCLTHGREHDRARVRPDRIKTAPTRAAVHPSADLSQRRLPPLPLRLHFALCDWLNDPGTEAATETLRAAMNEYELRSRLRRALPPVAPVPHVKVTPAIPVEEVTLANPNHRTTRLEFLADCETHGV